MVWRQLKSCGFRAGPHWALLYAAAALALASCQSATRLEDSGSRPGWGFDAAQTQRLRLVYGIEGSDNIALSFECRPTSGQITASAFPGDRKGAVVRLRSGQEQLTMPPAETWAHGVESFVSDMQLSTDAPLLSAFEGRGELFALAPRPRSYPASTPEERGDIRRFFAACRPPLVR